MDDWEGFPAVLPELWSVPDGVVVEVVVGLARRLVSDGSAWELDVRVALEQWYVFNVMAA